jgi:hypothetical protein
MRLLANAVVVATTPGAFAEILFPFSSSGEVGGFEVIAALLALAVAEEELAFEGFFFLAVAAGSGRALGGQCLEGLLSSSWTASQWSWSACPNSALIRSASVAPSFALVNARAV